LSEPILRRVPVILGKAAPAALLGFACVAFWKDFLATGKWTSLLWMASEGVVVVLLVLRRDSTSISRRPADWLAGIAGSFLVLLVRPSGTPLLPDAVGSALIVAGTAFQLWGKATLGRSFGIIAANRGVVGGGPYRIVRHPIYLGYLVTHVGFLASNGSVRNLAVYLATYLFQVIRIYAEERVLSEDGGYREYCRAVRYRLLPGLF
jgi:protein-S-isoprenylcysteine O-methyltransferase Ste14